MSYSVKNVKTFRGMEGYGFECSLYHDNKRIATVVDTANGGCYDFYWKDKAAEAKFDDYLASLPEETFNLGGGKTITTKPSGETVVGKLVDSYENDKKFRRLCKKKTLFSLRTDEKDTYRTLNTPYNSVAIEYLTEKYGENLAEIINSRFV